MLWQGGAADSIALARVDMVVGVVGMAVNLVPVMVGVFMDQVDIEEELAVLEQLGW